MDAWWRASLCLTVGQIYLRDNAPLRGGDLVRDLPEIREWRVGTPG